MSTYDSRLAKVEKERDALREQVRAMRSLVHLLDSLLVDLDCMCIPPLDKAEYRANIRAALEQT